MRLLVTRPEPDAARTAQTLRSRGHDALIAPLMRIEPVAAALAGEWSAVLMTSANAARALEGRAPELRRLPVFAVGDATAQAAREAGFADVTSVGGFRGTLVDFVVARLGGRSDRLLYVAGEHRAGDLAGDLLRHGITVRVPVVYRAVTADVLPADAARALAAGEIDAVLHYSRRSAATAWRLIEQAGLLNAALSLAHYCLSADVAAPLRGAARVHVASAPHEAALIDLVGRV